MAYLWPYTLLLLAAEPLLRRARAWMAEPTRLRRTAGLLLLTPVAWMLWVRLWLAPRYPETHAFLGDWTVHAESLPLFLLGYLLATQDWFWAWVQGMRWRTLVVAALAIGIELGLRWISRHPPTGPIPDWAMLLPWQGIERSARVTYAWIALLAIFGWARVLLDRPFRWLPYCSEAVFPWYILHQTLIVALAYWLVPLRMGGVAEALLVVGGTIAGCLLLHEFCIRRVDVLRPLFGLKRRQELAPARLRD
ncbi:MAG: acyltransferase, partial [Proteobacteria bacterium]